MVILDGETTDSVYDLINLEDAVGSWLARICAGCSRREGLLPHSMQGI